jgi:hypothetical protein
MIHPSRNYCIIYADINNANQAEGEQIMSNHLGHQCVSLLVPMARAERGVFEPMQVDILLEECMSPCSNAEARVTVRHDLLLMSA